MRSFWTKVDALEAWHASIVDKPWLQPLKPTKFVVVLIILSTLIAAGMNWYVRHWQYQVWEQNPQIFYLDDGTPLFTTTDATYFLGVAKAIKETGNVDAFQKLRLYPDANFELHNKPNSDSLIDVPLLSVVLSLIARDSTQKSLLIAGNSLIPVTAMFTALMIIFAFGACGYWIEGALAAAGGGLSFSYLTRSGAGRIDTDQLNLGFFYLIIGLMIHTAKIRSFYGSLIMAAISGAFFWVFDWWYSKPVFGWAFLIGFVWLSFVIQRDIKKTVFQAFVFITMSGLVLKGTGVNMQSAYLNDALSYNNLIFPNTFDTITELRKVQFSEILSRISGVVWLGTISFLGLLIWCMRHPAFAVIFAPAIGFILLNFVIGNRAIFYSAPMLWFGFAWAFIIVGKYVGYKFRYSFSKDTFLAIFTLFGFVTVWFSSPTSYVQGPSFNRATIQMFKELPDLTRTNNAAVITWWDYGYTSMFMNQMPTFHDGGLQTSPSTYFLANSLMTSSQERAASRFIDLKFFGGEGVVKSLVASNYPEKIEVEDLPVYLVLTNDMGNWISSISKIGNFDIFTGNEKRFEGVPRDFQLRYENLDCKSSNKANHFLCDNVFFNATTGKFGSQAILDGMVVSKDGYQITGQKFKNSNSPLMLHSEIGAKGSKNMLIHRDLYFSVFHQLFHVGRNDSRFFELVYDDYPYYRIYKVK